MNSATSTKKIITPQTLCCATFHRRVSLQLLQCNVTRSSATDGSMMNPIITIYEVTLCQLSLAGQFCHRNHKPEWLHQKKTCVILQFGKEAVMTAD